MPKLDPVTGPIPREEFARLIDAPYGAALKAIRKYDPMYGRAEGEKISWCVEVTAMTSGTARVEASSEEEAEKIAENLSSAEIDWDGAIEDLEVLSVRPERNA